MKSLNPEYGMKKYQSAVAFALCLIMALFLVAGCNRTVEPQEVVQDDEEQYDFSVFLGNTGDSVEISELILRYRDETGIAVKPIITEPGNDNERMLWRALESNSPPAAFLISANANEETISQGGFMADLSLIDAAVPDRSIPCVFRGYGWVVDKRLIADLVGADHAAIFIEDVRKADYGEWNAFVQNLSNYIVRGETEAFVINGKEYRFPEQKGAYAKQLNGVFAVEGGDFDFYGTRLLSFALRTSDMKIWEAARKSAVDAAAEALAAGNDAAGSDVSGTDPNPQGAGDAAAGDEEEAIAITTTYGALDAVRPGLNTYIEALDNLTSHLAGRYAPGVRSEGFVDSKLYGTKKVREIFAEGKAAFVAADSDDFDDLSALNAMRAANLTLLPLKMPYAESGLPTVLDGQIVNNCIPVQVTHSFAVNGRLSPESQKQALDFVQWFIDEQRALNDALERSVRDYFDKGNILAYDPNADVLKSYADDLRTEGLGTNLTNDKWDAEHKENLLNFMFTIWYED
jgi:hypothetical protein